MITAQGVHQVVGMGDQREATVELLERKLDNLDRMIAEWEPTNAWDAANKRPLKYMKRQRGWMQKAVDRLANKEKKPERRRQREESELDC
jgi:hypothetical protein